MIHQLPQNIQDNFIFQHDGHPAHSARIVTNYLNNTFGDRWIGRHGPIHWPARSPDLTTCDFWLWGYLKSKVYQRRVQNVEDLRERIIDAVENIAADMVQRSVHSALYKVQMCRQVNGEHFQQYR